MKKHKIKVFNGSYYAPDIYVEASKDIKDAELINLARQQSGLGRFKEWRFLC